MSAAQFNLNLHDLGDGKTRIPFPSLCIATLPSKELLRRDLPHDAVSVLPAVSCRAV